MAARRMTAASAERQKGVGNALGKPAFIKKKAQISDQNKRIASFLRFSQISPLSNPRFIQKTADLPLSKPKPTQLPLSDQSLSTISTNASMLIEARIPSPKPDSRAKALSKGYKLRRAEWQALWVPLP